MITNWLSNHKPTIGYGVLALGTIIPNNVISIGAWILLIIIALRRPDCVSFLIGFTIPFEITGAYQTFFHIKHFHISCTLGAVVIGLAAVRTKTGLAQWLPDMKKVKWLLVYFIWAGITIGFSSEKVMSARMFLNLIWLLAASFIIYYCLRNHDEQARKGMILSFIASLMITVVNVIAFNINRKGWTVTTFDGGWSSGLYAALIPFLMISMEPRLLDRRRAYLAGLLISGSVTYLLISNNRTAYFCFIVGLITFGYLNRSRFSMAQASTVLWAIIVIQLAGYYFLPGYQEVSGKLVNRMLDIFGPSFSHRIAMYKRCLYDTSMYQVLTGSGIGSLRWPVTEPMHSDYLQIARETGIIGVLMISWFIGTLSSGIRKHWQTAVLEERTRLSALISIMVMILTFMLAQNILTRFVVWFSLGIALSFADSSRIARQNDPSCTGHRNAEVSPDDRRAMPRGH